MKRRLGLFAAILLTAPMLLVSTPAAASDWFWGNGFRIGGFHFQIGHHHDHRGPYYRTNHRIPSRYRCTDRCYIDRDSYYHHDSCPVVRGHLSRYGYNHSYVYDHYAPSYRSYRYAPRRSYRYYDRGDRYDRRGRYDRRYDRRDHRRDRRYDRYDRRHDRRHDRYERRDDRRDRRQDWREDRRDRRHDRRDGRRDRGRDRSDRRGRG